MNTDQLEWSEKTRLLYNRYRNFCTDCNRGKDIYSCTADCKQQCVDTRNKLLTKFLDIVDKDIYAVIVTDETVRHIFKTGFRCGDVFTVDEIKYAYYDLFDRLSGDTFTIIRGLHRAQRFSAQRFSDLRR